MGSSLDCIRHSLVNYVIKSKQKCGIPGQLQIRLKLFSIKTILPLGSGPSLLLSLLQRNCSFCFFLFRFSTQSLAALQDSIDNASCTRPRPKGIMSFYGFRTRIGLSVRRTSQAVSAQCGCLLSNLFGLADGVAEGSFLARGVRRPRSADWLRGVTRSTVMKAGCMCRLPWSLRGLKDWPSSCSQIAQLATFPSIGIKADTSRSCCCMDNAF